MTCVRCHEPAEHNTLGGEFCDHCFRHEPIPLAAIGRLVFNLAAFFFSAFALAWAMGH